MTASIPGASFWAKVTRKTAEAAGICSFELADPSGAALPAFSAGAHIDLQLPCGLVRQYSLCNDPRETHRYLIAVLREPAGRGGSRALHDDIEEGDRVRIIPMASPADVSGLDRLIADGTVRAAEIVAVIGKTEGNGGVNDFTRGYFAQSLMHMLASHLGEPPEVLLRRIPCVLSGGTEGVVSPHYVVFCRDPAPPRPAPGAVPALAIGVAFSAPPAVETIGRGAHVLQVAESVRRAMGEAGISDPNDVRFVQLKCPCVTAVAAMQAVAQGRRLLTTDSNRSMAYARAAGAFGVALALGELAEADFDEAALLRDFDVYSTRASVSTGIEVRCNEIIVLGNSASWSGPYRIASRPMADVIDIAPIYQVLEQLGLDARPQLGAAQLPRVAGVFVKCEPDRRGRVRGSRNTMLDDTDINAQRHVRAAAGGLVAGVIGDGWLFVSGGAEHQGPDGGGLIAVIAAQPGTVARIAEPDGAAPA